MLESIRATTTAPVQFQRVDDTFLTEQEVTGRELPMWNTGRLTDGVLFENQRSIDAGLSFLPLATTAQATHDWYLSLPEEERVFTRSGLDPDKEAQVLAAWRARDAG
jgi:2'-hydroxyisoflavone reductase